MFKLEAHSFAQRIPHLMMILDDCWVCMFNFNVGSLDVVAHCDSWIRWGVGWGDLPRLMGWRVLQWKLRHWTWHWVEDAIRLFIKNQNYVWFAWICSTHIKHARPFQPVSLNFGGCKYTIHWVFGYDNLKCHVSSRRLFSVNQEKQVHEANLTALTLQQRELGNPGIAMWMSMEEVCCLMQVLLVFSLNVICKREKNLS